MLTHTSGIFSYTDDPRTPLVRLAGEPNAPQQIIAMAAEQPLRFAPGERFDYSNTNFLIAGLIAEHASGSSIGELLDERVFGPLELADTDFSLSQEIVGRSARGYLDPADAARHGARPLGAGRDREQPGRAGAAGGAVSTLADVARRSSRPTSAAGC